MPFMASKHLLTNHSWYSGSLQVNVEVETLISNGKAKTIDEAGTAGGTDGADVAVVDDTVAVDIFVLDVTGLHRAELLRGRIADVIIVLEESEGDETAHLIHAIAALVLVAIDVVLLVIFADLVLAVGDVATDGHAHVAELVVVAEVAVETA